MVIQEVVIRVEQVLVGSAPQVTVQHKGLTHPGQLLAICHAGMGQGLMELQALTAEQAAQEQNLIKPGGLN